MLASKSIRQEVTDMPRRMAPFVSEEQKRRAAERDKSRPNAARRGYCSMQWKATRAAVLRRDVWECQDCGKVCASSREAHVDHIVPKRAGGTDDLENLQTLCRQCHSRKTATEFRLGWGNDKTVQ